MSSLRKIAYPEREEPIDREYDTEDVIKIDGIKYRRFDPDKQDHARQEWIFLSSRTGGVPGPGLFRLCSRR